MISATLLGLLCFALVADVIVAELPPIDGCELAVCPGPVFYYKSLGCKPVFQKPGDCCPVRYNCDHLFTREKRKCYVNGHAYNEGEQLKPEDANPCDKGCFCRIDENGIGSFTCAIVDCFTGRVPDGCYLKNSPTQCCPGPQVCPENMNDRATCEVAGKIYKDGEYFESTTDPDKTCYCQEGFTGEEVEPFCKKPNRPYCSPEFRDMDNVLNNCTPAYYYTQSLRKNCPVAYRCQNERDVVVKPQGQPSTSQESPEEMKCKFGNMTLDIRDELTMGLDYDSVCLKCVCEVPPVVTCQRLSDAECDVTDHPPFN